MLTQNYNWRENTPLLDIVEELEHELNITNLCAKLLAIRGINDPDEGKEFLFPNLKSIEEPERIHDMEKAAKLFADYINNSKKIMVHGDFDVDGCTSTAILIKFCEALNLKIDYWIPNRLTDGYGVSEKSFDIIKEKNPDLLITVDCGISDAAVLEKIENELDCKVIVTDHHLQSGDVPNCFAVCNPNKKLCTSKNKTLAGVGVAWKLCWATAKVICGSDTITDKLRDFLLESMAIVAVGSVADCVPLLDDNRILVYHGLKKLKHSSWNGIKALFIELHLSGQNISAETIAWKVAPLMNAAGRMGDAKRTVSFLCEQDINKSSELIREIIRDNDERRRITTSLCDELTNEIDRNKKYKSMNALFFHGSNWHKGILGIVANRLVDKYNKPAIIISVDGDTASGSLRTVEGIHLGKMLDFCSDLLIKGGGHAMAAGISVETKNIPEVIERIEEFVKKEYEKGLEKPAIKYDASILTSELDEDFFKELKSLEPFGNGNPQPILKIANCNFITKPEMFGKAANHVKGSVSNSEGMTQLIAWNTKKLFDSYVKFDLIATPEVNSWNNNHSIRLIFKDGKSV